MDFSKYLDWIKLSPRYLLPISLFTGIALFASPQLLDTLGMSDVVEKYRPYIGFVFLLFSVLLVSSGLVAVLEFAAHEFLDRLLMRQRRRRLRRLTKPEKEVLRGYINDGTRTRYLRISDGVVGGLVAEGILYRSTTLSKSGDYFAYNIQPWAWEYLNSHPGLVA